VGILEIRVEAGFYLFHMLLLQGVNIFIFLAVNEEPSAQHTGYQRIFGQNYLASYWLDSSRPLLPIN
jgi:hypothetical protein